MLPAEVAKVEVDNTLLWYEDCTHSMLVVTLQYYISKVGVGGGGVLSA